MNVQIFGAPRRYIQGAGAINTIGDHVKQIGSRVLAVGGCNGLEITRESRGRSFSDSGIFQREELFGGEACDREIERLAKAAKDNECDVILASGGGKAIDTVKAAAELTGAAAVIVPTIASNDAPCSALSVIHNEDGTHARLMILKNSPALVLVDTEIIARSPVRQFVTGMGDALATWFEAEACRKSGAVNNFGGQIGATTMALARLCLDTLLEYGREAKKSCEERKVTFALERVVEANTLLSGLGFESGGVAVAHAIYDAFTGIPAMRGSTHGEKVAFGLIVQMILEGRTGEELREIHDFCSGVGLPVRLADLGYNGDGADGGDDAELRAAAAVAAAPGGLAQNLRAGITGAEIYEAIIQASALGGERADRRLWRGEGGSRTQTKRSAANDSEQARLLRKL